MVVEAHEIVMTAPAKPDFIVDVQCPDCTNLQTVDMTGFRERPKTKRDRFCYLTCTDKDCNKKDWVSGCVMQTKTYNQLLFG